MRMMMSMGTWRVTVTPPSAGLALERIGKPSYVADSGPSHEDLIEQLTEYARHGPELKRIRRYFFATDEAMQILLQQLNSRQ